MKLLALTILLNLFGVPGVTNETVAQTAHEAMHFGRGCTGGTCRVCKNCKYCKHCSKQGGKCSVCK